MARSAYHDVHAALTSTSSALDTVLGLPTGTSGEGKAAEALAETLQGIRSHAAKLKEHVDASAGKAATVASADDELMRHPSPEEDKKAEADAKKAVALSKAQQIAPSVAAAKVKHAADVHGERMDAVQAHDQAQDQMTEPPETDDGEGEHAGGYQHEGGNGSQLGGLNGSGFGGSGGSGGGGYSGGSGGSSSGSESPVGTRLSSDSGTPTNPYGQGGQPQMPQMQPSGQGQGQGAGGASPMGGGMPSAVGAPGANMPKYGDKKKRDDGLPDYSTVLSGSGDGLGGAAVAGTALDTKGSSIRDLKTLSDTSGVNRPSVGATGVPPGGGAGGQAGAMGRGGMMGGGMGSGAGMGGSAKPKEKPDIKSSNPEQHGFDSRENAVDAGLIGRDSAATPTVEDDLDIRPSMDRERRTA